MALTYEPITSTTLTSNQASVVLSSIPNSYTDLRLVLWIRSTFASGRDNALVRLNSITTQYAHQQYFGNGTSATSSRSGSLDYYYVNWIPGTTTDGGAMGFIIMDMLNYKNTSTDNMALTQSATVGSGNGANFQVGRYVHRNAYTDAITSITISTQNGSVASGGVLTVFGIKAA